MRHRTPLYVVAALLVSAAPLAAHPGRTGGSPLCFSEPPPRNSEGPPEEKGFWEEVVDLGQQAIHMVHLPGGRVLLWGYNGSGGLGKIYTPETGALADITLGSPGFCSGHTHLPDGGVLIAGGQGRSGGQSTIFDPFTDTFSAPTPLYARRYYPTLTSLADGRVFSASGTGSKASTPEVYDPTTNTWTPLGCEPGYTTCRLARLKMHWYARTTITPDARIFVTPASRTLWAHTFDFDSETWTKHEIGTETSGKMTSAPAAYIAPGKLLRAGADIYGNFTVATADASIVDFSDSLNPTYTPTTPMNYARNRNTLTLLADGTVLATGGIRDAPCASDMDDPHVYHAELYDPETETWRILGAMQNHRVYHSSAVLLRDGSVLTAGGEPKQKTSQIFRPPYLFQGPRPVVTSAPAEILLDAPFEVFTSSDPAAVSQVNLLRLGSSTHAYDENQRIVRLPFVAGIDRLTVTGPANPYDAPPGYYMLFLISDAGVPSVAEYVKVLPACYPCA